MNRLLAGLVLAVLPAPVRGFLRLPMLAATSATPERGRTRGARPFIARRLSRGFPLVFVIVIALAACPRIAHAVGPAISVSPATAAAGVGADVTLDIDATSVSLPGLGGYLIVLQWNPALLTLTSLADSGWVTEGDIIVLCSTPTIDNTNGTAELDCTPVFGFGSGVTTSAPHALAHAVFHAKASGTTTIDLSGSELLNPSNIVIQSTLANGSVTVAIPPTPVPGAVGGIAEDIDPRALPPQTAGAGAGQHRSNFAAIAIVAVGVAFSGAAGYRTRTSRR